MERALAGNLSQFILKTALEASSPVNKVIKKVTDVVRSLPYRLAFSDLDRVSKDKNQPQ
ncbi:hypothetical protein VP01_5142g1 [Puccinia sorghi]|uniref:Uncharacterized protein n=1 Tax=Puccinia sorghi TaxID=27349 RepID=A0A0L6UMZ5_9BASI|nr:hypothetical protein VP01_5142g1 [Puccinia sorghi]